MVAIKDFEMPSCCIKCMLTTCKGKDEPWNYCCSVTLTDIFLEDNYKPTDCPLVEIKAEEKLEKIEQIANEWNNDASHSFSDMCKINGILKE